MIKRIQNISGLGIFQNYRRDNNLQEFAEKNLIYGWNYSGKTTLSRLFSFLEKKEIPDEFAETQFEIKLYGNNNPEPITHDNIDSCPLKVKVFNSDYIANNLRYNTSDKKIQGIKFDVGENASLRETIEENLTFIASKTTFIENHKANINKFREFENSKFTKVAGHIKNNCFKSVIEFNKSHLKKIIPQLEKDKLDSYIISDEALLKSTQNISIAQTNKEPIEVQIPESCFDTIFEEFKRILSFAPNKSVEDALLSNNNSVYSWVKDGLSIHAENELKQCAFCGNPLHDSRMAFLNEFFTNQAAILKSDIENLLTKIEIEKGTILNGSWMRISPNDFSEGLKDKWIETLSNYTRISDNYIGLLEKFKVHLNEKSSSKLFISIKTDDIDVSANLEKETWLQSIGDLIKSHNEAVEKFTTIREENRTKYKNHLVASFLKEERYYEIERRSQKEEIENNEIQELIKEKELENTSLLSQLKSITAGKTRLNAFIKLFLNRDDIQIETSEDEYFILKRGEKIARNLSEGEKTAIAFAYFIVSLESIEKDGDLNEYIIFIDDPISSLDANHIAQVSALINSFFFRKPSSSTSSDKTICKVRQLFISTHNFEFLSFLRDASNLRKKRNVMEYINGENTSGYGCLRFFMIKRIDDCSSAIIGMPKYLTMYKSEYVYLFFEIYSFYEDGCPEERNHLMPNAIRRFLEMYTLTRLPGNSGEVDSRIKEIVGDITELKILHQFSHFTSFERVTKHNELLLRLPEIMEDIFTLLSHDTQHYHSLLEAIGKSEPVLKQAIPQ